MNNMKMLSDGEIMAISGQCNMDPDVVRSWYKDFLQCCPTGKMVFVRFLLWLEYFLIFVAINKRTKKTLPNIMRS